MANPKQSCLVPAEASSVCHQCRRLGGLFSARLRRACRDEGCAEPATVPTECRTEVGQSEITNPRPPEKCGTGPPVTRSNAMRIHCLLQDCHSQASLSQLPWDFCPTHSYAVRKNVNQDIAGAILRELARKTFDSSVGWCENPIKVFEPVRNI